METLKQEFDPNLDAILILRQLSQRICELDQLIEISNDAVKYYEFLHCPNEPEKYLQELDQTYKTFVNQLYLFWVRVKELESKIPPIETSLQLKMLEIVRSVNVHAIAGIYWSANEGPENNILDFIHADKSAIEKFIASRDISYEDALKKVHQVVFDLMELRPNIHLLIGGLHLELMRENLNGNASNVTAVGLDISKTSELDARLKGLSITAIRVFNCFRQSEKPVLTYDDIEHGAAVSRNSIKDTLDNLVEKGLIDRCFSKSGSSIRGHRLSERYRR